MRSRAVAAFVLAMLAASAVAGCGPSHGKSPGSGAQGGSPAGGPPAAQCGTVRTAAGVPVVIEVLHGSADCHAALAIERAYTRAVASGKVHGNGPARDSIPRKCWPPATPPPATKTAPKS